MSKEKKPTPPCAKNGTSPAADTTAKCPLAPSTQSLGDIAKEVNPKKGTMNCGNIIDAVIARLDGSDPKATAPDEQDGSWEEIEERHNTTISWGSSFDDAFKKVKDGGDGTTAIIGIKYKDSTSSHVVVLANHGGVVGIVEGQDASDGKTPGVIGSAEDAKKLYGEDSDVGIGILPKKGK